MVGLPKSLFASFLVAVLAFFFARHGFRMELVAIAVAAVALITIEFRREVRRYPASRGYSRDAFHGLYYTLLRLFYLPKSDKKHRSVKMPWACAVYDLLVPAALASFMATLGGVTWYSLLWLLICALMFIGRIQYEYLTMAHPVLSDHKPPSTQDVGADGPADRGRR